MRLGEAAIAALVEISYDTNMSSRPMITFFNSFGLTRPVVKMLDSKRAFADEAWRELNGTPRLGDAINQILSPHYWPDEQLRNKRISALRKSLTTDGLDIVEHDDRLELIERETVAKGRRAKRPAYSLRKGTNPNADGFQLPKIKEMFGVVYNALCGEGYFDEYLGFYCVDRDVIPGKIKSPESDLLLHTRKDHLWPIHNQLDTYSEDDLFDVIEYLFTATSKPLTGTMHAFNECGMHWETFDKRQGELEFCRRVNGVLDLYVGRFELSHHGEILHKADDGLQPLLEADLPASEAGVQSRVNAAILRYRRHGSTLDDRRQAVRDLVDVAEFLRDDIKSHLSNKDEADLFNIANNYGIRHHRSDQKIGYDASIWLSWMFYFYLSTIHLVLRLRAKTK
jgi:hypothetical protein